MQLNKPNPNFNTYRVSPISSPLWVNRKLQEIKILSRERPYFIVFVKKLTMFLPTPFTQYDRHLYFVLNGKGMSTIMALLWPAVLKLHSVVKVWNHTVFLLPHFLQFWYFHRKIIICCPFNFSSLLHSTWELK